MVSRFRLRFEENRRRRRLGQRDIDQPLHDVARIGDANVQAVQQSQTERDLNGSDRGERICTLPRPRRFLAFSVSGHPIARYNALPVIAAAMPCSQRTIDRTAGDDAAHCACRSAEQPVTEQAMPNHRTGNAANDLAGSGR